MATVAPGSDMAGVVVMAAAAVSNAALDAAGPAPSGLGTRVSEEEDLTGVDVVTGRTDSMSMAR